SMAVAALSIPRRTPVPHVKRRSLVPVIVGAGLVLGAGGAAMIVFGRGHRADNAARLGTMRGVPPPVAADSTSRAVPPPPPPPAPPTVVVSEAQVRRTLESVTLDLQEGKLTAKAARDTAEYYYATPALPKVYQAAAARIVCDSYLIEKRRSLALQWCQRASDL